jgi:dTDP-4-dehydrorhamnose reductase
MMHKSKCDKILVFGSSGMLGHVVCNYLASKNKYTVIPASNQNKAFHNTFLLDIRNLDNVEKYLNEIKPDIVINCAGLLISESQNRLEDAIIINSLFPNLLSRLGNVIDFRLIHISTDCVFSGYKGKYNEHDYRDGRGFYSQTKILGEVYEGTNLTLRTSIIGPELNVSGNGLFHWFMNQSKTISGYTKTIWSGVTTLELAKAVEWSINENITGIYHITNNTSLSKKDLLELFKKHTKKDLEITHVEGSNLDKSFVDTRKLINYIIPTYDKMISDMIDYISRNSSLYSQYHIPNDG